MNWARGFFRLWLAISLIWIITVFAYEHVVVPAKIAAQRACADARKGDASLGNPNDCFDKGHVRFDDLISVDAIPYLGWALVPPFVILALGLILGWIFSGFRRPTT